MEEKLKALITITPIFILLLAYLTQSDVIRSVLHY